MADNKVNLYEPRSQAGVFDKKMPVTTFLRDTFFPETRTFTTEHVDLDFQKGRQLVAPFVAPNVGGINIRREGFETRSYTPPRVAPQRPISKDVLQPRLPGELLHTAMSPEERQDYYLNKDAQELDDMITRREEVMCSQILTTGVANVRGYLDDSLSKYQDDNVDFQFSNLTTLTGADQWSEATSTKYADLDTAMETIAKAGYNPQHAIFGRTAWRLLEADESFQKKLDLLRYDVGRISPELRLQNGNGLKYLGYISDLGLNFWIYYAWYMDNDGTLKPYIPDNYVVVAPAGLGEMLYGAITQLEEDKQYHTYEGTRVPKVLVNLNDDVMTYRLSSRPLPKPFDVDAWVSINTAGGA